MLGNIDLNETQGSVGGKGKEMLHDYVCVSDTGPHGLGRGDLKRRDVGGHIGVDSRAPRDVQLFWGAHPSSA